MKHSKAKAPKPLIIFCHMPKTGGTTLSSIIYQNYRRSDIFELLTARTAVEMADEINGLVASGIEPKIFKGHLGFGIHELFDQPFPQYTYVTMLRDPIERVVSRYYHLRRKNQKRPVHELALNTTLKEFSCKVEDNSMTRFFSGADFQTQLFLGDENSTYVNVQDAMVTDINVRTYRVCSSDLLALAKENLRTYFSIVGLTERFDETLILLQKKFGWKNIYYTKQMVNKKRSSIDEIPKDTLEVIEKNNELDIELYCYAQELFADQIKKYGSSFEEDFKKFQSLNPIYGKLNAISDSTKESINQRMNSSKQFVKRMLRIPS